MNETVDASKNLGQQAPSIEQESISVEQLTKTVLGLEEQLLRARADLDNVRKRSERERQEWIRTANARLLEDLLAVADAFKMGLEAAQNSVDVKSVLLGFEAVQVQLRAFFQSQGVEVLNPVGILFDAQNHECVAHAFDPEIPEDCVSSVVRVGYSLNGRLLRPACVIVSKGPDVKAL